MNAIAAYKVAGGSEPSNYTWSGIGGITYPFGDIFRFDTYDSSTPIGNYTYTSGTGTPRTIGSVITSYDNSKIFIASIGQNTAGAVSGMTQISNHFNTHILGHEDKATAGTISSRTHTHGNSSSWATAIIVINGAI
jgi:hypothetical protein